MKPVLVLGIGNVLKGDDGAGPAVVRWLQQHATGLGDGVELIDGGTGGHSLLPVMRGRKKIVIVDAMLSAEKPGRVRRLSAGELPAETAPWSLHASGIRGMVKSLRLLGERPEVQIVAISARDVRSTRMELSGEVQRAVPAAASEVMQALIG